MLKDTEAVVPALGVTLLPLAVKGSDDIDRAFGTIRKERAAGLLQFVGLGGHKRRIVDLAAENRLPAIYTRGQWVSTGGLMSYGTHWPDLYRRGAKFDLVVNLKAAKQIGLTIPPEFLMRADRVIK
jgi:putative ABC transport system substrate-binding protein